MILIKVKGATTVMPFIMMGKSLLQKIQQLRVLHLRAHSMVILHCGGQEFYACGV